MDHKQFLKKLGKGDDIARWVSVETGEPIKRDAVYKWGSNGVPFRWRPILLKMAREKGVSTPSDFIPGVAA